MGEKLILNEDRFFDPDPAVRAIARDLYRSVRNLPIVCPHGHVDPRLFADNRPFPGPAELMIIPDHYVFRMLYSQGIPFESLGVPRTYGVPVERDMRKIWQIFGEHFHLFAGTPSGVWLSHELSSVFGVAEKLTGESAQRIYDHIQDRLLSPEFLPRALYDRFGIEVLTTTDAATDTLEHHRAIRESGWNGRVIPCFRPDGVINLNACGWLQNLGALSEISGIDISSYPDFIRALENRREFFKSMGAVSTDHAVLVPYTHRLSEHDAESIFLRALRNETTDEDAFLFTAHMLMEMARMSTEDGLVMQLHPGSYRDHNTLVYDRFGPDRGCDIPVRTEFTENLRELLNAYGNDARLTVIVFTLDESAYSRELAPLAGHYPAMKLGPAWWFHDSIEGMKRYRRSVTETAGIYNTVGFNDDTRAFPSIPARHDLARRVDADFLAGMVARHIIDETEAHRMIRELTYNLVKRSYRLDADGG